MEQRDMRVPDTAMAEEVLIGLNTIFPIIKRLFGVKKIGMFGALARRDAIKVDRIEILVEFSPGFETYRYYIGLKNYLEEHFKTRINLVTTRTLSGSLDTITGDPDESDARRENARQILTEFEFLHTRCKGISVEAFSRDTMLRRAAERSMEVAGLAARCLGRDHGSPDETSPWKELEEIGASIACSGFGADPQLLWHYIVTEVPGIMKQIRSFIRSPLVLPSEKCPVNDTDSRNAKE
jgi:uncharacterized protein